MRFIFTLLLMMTACSRSLRSLLLLLAPLAFSPVCPAGTYGDWVRLHYSSAEIAAGLASPLCDDDGDDCPNIAEYFGGSHPRQAASLLTLRFAEDAGLGEVTVDIPADPACSDLAHVVLVSNDLIHWHEGAVFLCHQDGYRYHLNGHRYVKVGVLPRSGIFIDTDEDGLLDFFEEALVSADQDDAFASLADILPGDDFDGDGTPNIAEEDNTVYAGESSTKPALIPLHAVVCALEALAPAVPAGLLVHTPLQ